MSPTFGYVVGEGDDGAGEVGGVGAGTGSGDIGGGDTGAGETGGAGTGTGSGSDIGGIISGGGVVGGLG